jgi:hypothetical protein
MAGSETANRYQARQALADGIVPFPLAVQSSNGAAIKAAVTTYARPCFVSLASRFPVTKGTPVDS